MERQKNDSIRRRESSIDRSIHSSLAYLSFFFREERFPRLRTAVHALFLPTKIKRAIDNLDNLNKNAEVSVPQSYLLFPFFSQPHFFFHLELVKAKNLINRRKRDQKDTRTTLL